MTSDAAARGLPNELRLGLVHDILGCFFGQMMVRRPCRVLNPRPADRGNFLSKLWIASHNVLRILRHIPCRLENKHWSYWPIPARDAPVPMWICGAARTRAAESPLGQ
jgi:hypothetical protein